MGIKNLLGKPFRWYASRDRAKIIGSLTSEEIKGTQNYKDAETIYGARISELIQGNNTLLGELERAEEELFKERGKSKIYEERISQAADSIKHLSVENRALSEKQALYETNVADLEGRFSLLEEANAKLASERQRAVVDLVLHRMGRGEKPSDFNCPDLEAKLIREYGELRTERDSLREVLRNLEHGSYKHLLSYLESTGKLKGHFSLLYIDSRRIVSNASQNIEDFIGIASEEVKGKKLKDITKGLIGGSSTKGLLRDWRDSNHSYKAISLRNGGKVDVLVQKVQGHGDNLGGAFVYIARHRSFWRHTSHEEVLGFVKAFSDTLSSFYS